MRIFRQTCVFSVKLYHSFWFFGSISRNFADTSCLNAAKAPLKWNTVQAAIQAVHNGLRFVYRP